MNKVKWIIFAVVVLTVFGGIIWLGKSNEVKFTGDANRIISEGPIADHVKGSQDQKVTLIEYGDFQCPGCGQMYPTVEEITEKYKDKVTFIFRNLPLTHIHPNALAAATAAEAAGKQEKYFDMYGILFQSQDSWSSASVGDRGKAFENYAAQIGLNLDQYRTDLTSKDLTEKINRDIYTGKQVFTATSTPTFILDGKKVENANLAAAVDEVVKAAYPNAQTTAQPQE